MAAFDGRVSKRDTAFYTATPGTPLSARESFTQSFGYNALGLASSLAYPLCTHAECTPAAPAAATSTSTTWAARD